MHAAILHALLGSQHTASSEREECSLQRQEIRGDLSKLFQFPVQKKPRPRVLKGLIQGHSANPNSTQDTASWLGVLSRARILPLLLPLNRSDFYSLCSPLPAGQQNPSRAQGSNSLQISLLPSRSTQSLLWNIPPRNEQLPPKFNSPLV